MFLSLSLFSLSVSVFQSFPFSQTNPTSFELPFRCTIESSFLTSVLSPTLWIELPFSSCYFFLSPYIFSFSPSSRSALRLFLYSFSDSVRVSGYNFRIWFERLQAMYEEMECSHDCHEYTVPRTWTIHMFTCSLWATCTQPSILVGKNPQLSSGSLEWFRSSPWTVSQQTRRNFSFQVRHDLTPFPPSLLTMFHLSLSSLLFLSLSSFPFFSLFLFLFFSLFLFLFSLSLSLSLSLPFFSLLFRLLTFSLFVDPCSIRCIFVPGWKDQQTK